MASPRKKRGKFKQLLVVLLFVKVTEDGYSRLTIIG
jgi:hypothetical protein